MMNPTQYILFTILAAGFLAPMIVEAVPNPAIFQAEKDREIANVQQRLQITQDRLACVQAAGDKAALKLCRSTAKLKWDALEKQTKAENNQ